MDTCYIVVPCFNEEDCLPITAQKLKEKVISLKENNKISQSSKILFIDDGSKDRTWEIISELHEKDSLFTGVKLSANCGHEKALYAGLVYAKSKCDFTISLDADLQDPINVCDLFVEKYQQGYQVVYGVRNSRKTDSFLKRNTALCFYRLANLLGANIIHNHADCRLVSSIAIENLEQFKERNLFLRGLMPLLGFKQTTVSYERAPRNAGQTKYPFLKLFFLALEAITSFSISPIRIIGLMGVLISMLSSCVFLYFFVSKLLGEAMPMGYASVICSIWILGGLQLFSIGVIGEYIGKTYIETKSRPRYFIEKSLE